MSLLIAKNTVYNLDLIKRVTVTVDGQIVKIDLDGEIEEVPLNSEEDAKKFHTVFLDLLLKVETGYFEILNFINGKSINLKNRTSVFTSINLTKFDKEKPSSCWFDDLMFTF